VSYAAAAGGRPPPQPVLSAVETAYANYLRAFSTAFRQLNAAPLQGVETGSVLAHDEMLIERQIASNQFYRVSAEHNERLGVQQDGVVWVYDTIADHSVTVDRTSHEVGGAKNPTYITRSSYKFIQEGDGWKVDDIVGAD
jgi:hypothetical protein